MNPTDPPKEEEMRMKRRSGIRRWIVFLSVILVSGFGLAAQDKSAAPNPPDIAYVMQNLKRTHPRLFLNQEMLGKVKRDGLTPEQQEWLKKLKKHRVDGYPTPPPIDAKLIEFMLSEKGGRRYSSGAPRVDTGYWSLYAAHAALVYLLTGERKYYDRAVEFLRHAAGIYKVIIDNKRTPLGHAWDRLLALSAYDWLYNDLPEKDRIEIGQSLFASLNSFFTAGKKGLGKSADEYVQYSDDLLGWYLGVVFHGSGIPGVGDDVTAPLLKVEYERYVAAFRKDTSGPDGVVSRGAIGYAKQLPEVGITFLDSWRTAVGGNFARYFPKHANLAEYFLWNTIPAKPEPREYGWADSYHDKLRIGPTPYLLRVPDLYADMGDLLDVARLSAIAAFQSGLYASGHRSFYPFIGTECALTPASPLYMRPTPSAAEIQAALASLPRARHFAEPVSQTFMNSGWDENATYALFIAGKEAYPRKHWDENHFTIYKKGFLAMDTGARGHADLPGGPNYYFNTLAHNCVLIQMEGEVLPGLWGSKSTVNTGGMNKNSGAVVKGFETNDRYTYIASDASACYNEAKAQEVIRQFVFIYPDYFVVFDRVASKKPEQKKTWLFHTQEEPEVQTNGFSAVQREGKIFVRTLLPKEPKMVKVGGPGKEFWAGGQNWPIDPVWLKQVDPTGTNNLFGQWRMEISASQDNQKDLFLHLLQVGDRQELKVMVPSRLIEDKSQAGVEFDTGKATIRVVFNKAGDIGGNIWITENGKQVLSRRLTSDVMPQNGLALQK